MSIRLEGSRKSSLYNLIKKTTQDKIPEMLAKGVNNLTQQKVI